MPRGGLKTVIGHWSLLMEGMQASPQAFYAAIEAAIERREIPGCRLRRVVWPEGGFFSARREYLRAKRGQHLIDICGAPFGTAFFSSSWLCFPPPHIWIAVVLAIIGLVYGLDTAQQLTRMDPFHTFGMNDQFRGAITERAVKLGLDFLFVILVVIFGIIRPLFFPPRETYYRIDTAEMFYEAVHQSVLEVIDGLRTEQGLRALSEAERKPIMRGFGR